jgi:hypothetical protein
MLKKVISFLVRGYVLAKHTEEWASNKQVQRTKLEKMTNQPRITKPDGLLFDELWYFALVLVTFCSRCIAGGSEDLAGRRPEELAAPAFAFLARQGRRSSACRGAELGWFTTRNTCLVEPACWPYRLLPTARANNIYYLEGRTTMDLKG